MLTSQDPGVGSYEGLHGEAGAGRGPTGSRLTPRPWPMPRPPGPGLRAEHRSAGATAARGAGGGRPNGPRQRPKAVPPPRPPPLRPRFGARHFVTSQGGGADAAGAGPTVPAAVAPPPWGARERGGRRGAGGLRRGPGSALLCSARNFLSKRPPGYARGSLRPHFAAPGAGWCRLAAGTWAGRSGTCRPGRGGREFVFSFWQGLALASNAQVPPLVGGGTGIT